MNNARLGVGFECDRPHARRPIDWRSRLRRKSGRAMGKTIDKHEMIADYLDEMRTDIAGHCVPSPCTAGYHEEMAQKLGLR